MKVKTIFTSKEGMPFDEELVVIVGHNEYLKAHAEAIRGFLADLQAVNRRLMEDIQYRVRKAEIEKEQDRLTSP